MATPACASFVSSAALPSSSTRRYFQTTVTPERARPLPRHPRLSLAKPPAAGSKRSKQADPVPYVGVPPPSNRGRLRFAPETRFLEENISPADESALVDPNKQLGPKGRPQLETRANTTWQRENKISRYYALWTFIGNVLFTNWRDSKSWTYSPFGGGRTEQRISDRRRALARYARKRILQLGPTMIKVGQLASTRADLFPSEIVEELRLLQDRVPAFSWETARTVLETEYGKDVNEVFQYLDKTPIAAASLGQVHRAVLPSGQHVVIKIQRPKLKQLFDMDLEVLRGVAFALQKSKKYGGNGRDWVGIYEECSRVLYEEIDYVREANSCQRFGDNFKLAGIPWVRVPKVYYEYTTTRVLCLQYVPGIKISDVATLQRAGLDTKLVANRVANAFIRQVLDFTFFSSDPHPGNVAVGANETIIFYDFGMMGELNPRIKERLIDILAGVLDRDAQLVMDALVDLDALVLPADPSPVRRSIQFFLDSIGNRPSREQTVAAIGDDLYATAYDKPFRLPAASIFLLRAFSTLEGLAKSLDPDFKFADVALPYADELLKDRSGGLINLSSQSSTSGSNNSPQKLIRNLARTVAAAGGPSSLSRQVSKQVVSTGSDAVKSVARIEKIEKTLTALERGDIKLRSRSTETEKLLRKQYSLTQSSNLLVSTGTTALAATQLYASGSEQPAVAMALLSAIVGLMFLRSQVKLNKKDPFG